MDLTKSAHERSGTEAIRHSLAATHTFRGKAALLWQTAIGAIFKSTTLNNLSIGQAGEEYVQIILTASLDSAAATRPEVQHLALVFVHDWLKALLNPQILKVGVNTSEVYQKILAWAADYSINFTHFMQLDALCTSNKPLTHFALAQAWLRQAAIIGAEGQTKWDLLVPIYRDYSPEADFHPQHVSYIAIQVKNRKASSSGWTGDFAAHIQGFGGTETAEHDRLLLWMDLNKDNKIEAVCDVSTKHHMQTRSQRSAQHTRYNLRIDGHGARTYKVINTFADPKKPEQLGDQLDLCIQSLNAYRSGHDSPSTQALRDRKMCQGRFVPWSDPLTASLSLPTQE